MGATQGVTGSSPVHTAMKNIYIFNCQKCGKEYKLELTENEFNKGKYKKFCSRSCANSRVHSEETKQKQRNSLMSYLERSGKRKQYNCIVCGKQYHFGNGNSTKKCCSKECSFYLRTHRKDFLSDEALQQLSMAGRKSVSIQGDARRSKNEIEFYKLCKAKFVNVDSNEPIFNGWDADIIIHDYKVAVLWNGPWHYKEIYKNTSLAQIQNRDRIKESEIKKIGYIPYIIKDMGKANIDFVKQEFVKFLEFINNVG